MQLPPTREFCRLLAVSRQTVLNAYALLTAEGYLDGTVGRGTLSAATCRPLSRSGDSGTGIAAAPVGARAGRGGGHAVALTVARCAPSASACRASTISRSMCGTAWKRGAGAAPTTSSATATRPATCAARAAVRLPEGLARQLVHAAADRHHLRPWQALFLLSTILLAPGESAWMESPGYRAPAARCARPARAFFPCPSMRRAWTWRMAWRTARRRSWSM